MIASRLLQLHTLVCHTKVIWLTYFALQVAALQAGAARSGQRAYAEWEAGKPALKAFIAALGEQRGAMKKEVNVLLLLGSPIHLSAVNFLQSNLTSSLIQAWTLNSPILSL